VNLCILSGKGGTGKTTLAVNLAVLMQAGYCDCDVEEPNGFIFLKPGEIRTREIFVDLPSIDEQKCTLCGACTKACQYSAMARTKKSIMLFPTLCHGCHACEIVCEPNAISYVQRSIGRVETGNAFGIACASGIMNVGEHMAVPIIRQLLDELDTDQNYILDCAPGSSCNVVSTLRHSDAALIVTEPTAFGLHDMAIAVELLTRMRIPFAVVINKSGEHDAIIEKFCQDRKIRIAGKIPYSRAAAEAYSNGLMLFTMPEFRSNFEAIAQDAKKVFSWN